MEIYRKIVIAALLLMAGAVPMYANEHVPNDTTLVTSRQLQLQEVLVVSRKTEVPSDAYRLVALISHEEIAALPVQTVADLLHHLPGVDVRTRGVSGAQADVSLRGGTFDQVQVLLNGVPMQDVQTGHYSLNIPISSALIERIEILSAADQALCGAINIVTRRYVEKDSYALQMGVGMNGDVNPVFAGTWRGRTTTTNASVEYARSEGYYAPTADDKEQEALRNTDFQMANLYVQTRWRGFLDAQAGMQYKDAGLGTGYGYASTDQFDATRTMFASLQSKIPVGHWALRTMVAYRGQYDRYEWHRGTPLNTHWTHNTQASFDAEYRSEKAGATSFGAAFKDEFIRSSNMGVHNRWQATLQARHSYQWRGLEALLSVAGHYNSWCGWYGSGMAEVGYAQPHYAVSLSATRSLRMPTWTDLYYKAGVQRGDSTLQAEKAWTLTLNGQYSWSRQDAGRLQIAGDIYYRWGQDIIDWNYNETDGLFHATNQNKVNTFGVEVGAEYHYNNWLRTVSVRYAYTNLSLDVTNVKSNYLDYLKHKVVLQLDHGIYVWQNGCVGANWSLRWQDREGTYVDIHGVAGNAYKPVLLLDGCVYVDLLHVRVSAECTNMTNRHYYDYGGILQPGAWAKVRIRAKL